MVRVHRKVGAAKKSIEIGGCVGVGGVVFFLSVTEVRKYLLWVWRDLGDTRNLRLSSSERVYGSRWDSRWDSRWGGA